MGRMAPGTRFATSIILITLAFMVLAAGLAYRLYTSERDDRINETAALATSAGINADRFLGDRLDILSTMARAPSVRAGDLTGVSDYLNSLDLETLGFAGGVGWADKDGLLRISTVPELGTLPIDISDRTYFKAVVSSKAPNVGEAIQGRVQEKPVLPLAVPTFNERNVLNGVLIGAIRLDLLEGATKEQRFGTNQVTIVDRQGTVIIEPQSIDSLEDVSSNRLLKLVGTTGSGVLMNVNGIHGETNHIVGYSHAPTGGWTVLIDRSEGDVIGSVRRTFLFEIAGLCLIGMLVSGGAIWSGHGINQSAVRENAALRALAVREARLSALTEATTQVIWTADSSGVLRDPDKRWNALTGVDIADLDRSEWLPYVDLEDRGPGNDAWQAGISSGAMIEFEQRVHQPNDEIRNYLVRAVPVREEDGQILEWIGVDIDVTNQRRAEDALRERETFAREVIEGLIAYVAVMTPDGVVITTNRAARLVLGVPEAEILGRPAWEAHAFSFAPEHQERLKEAIVRAAAGEYIRYDALARLGDDRLATIDLAIGAVRDERGEIQYLVASAIDITERTLAERLVAASEERYRALVEATSTVVWRTTADGNAFFVGTAWNELTGQTTEEMAGSGWLNVVHPDERERVIATWRESVKKQSIHSDEFRVRVRDGSYRFFVARGVPVFDEDGNVHEWVGANTDIHDRRRAEEELRQTAERLSMALEAGQLDTWDWDVQADRLTWTEAAEARLGPAPKKIDSFLESLHPDDRARVQEAIRRSLEDHEPYDIEYRTRDANGIERWLYVRGEAFHDPEGRPLRMIGVDVDVTERKNQEAFEQDFVANVAHDIKNPLAAVKAQTQLLRRRLASGKANLDMVDSVLEVLDSGLSRMNRRIEELADVARLRAGQNLDLRVDRTNLKTLVVSIINAYQQASDRHVMTVAECDEELIGVWDAGRIERVCDNLISNAIKYSPNGGTIEIRLSKSADDGRDWAVLTVSDSGIGIPRSDLPHIFERYRRAANTAVISGTGIGLAGARQIVEQHGGSITVESLERIGSTFTVRLPLSIESDHLYPRTPFNATM
jgi:PAS domain S-box-containing protein